MINHDCDRDMENDVQIKDHYIKLPNLIFKVWADLKMTCIVIFYHHIPPPPKNPIIFQHPQFWLAHVWWTLPVLNKVNGFFLFYKMSFTLN